MPNFFAAPSNTVFDITKKLHDYNEQHVSFNQRDGAHTQLVHDCCFEINKTLTQLQGLDKNALLGFSAGAVAFGLSYILPFGLIATAGFAYGAYQLGLRAEAYREYTSALNNLMSCCKWVLGDVKDDAALLEQAPIKRMIKELAPLTTEAQLRTCLSDFIADAVARDAAPLRNKVVVLEHELSEEEATLHYKMYGYEQGGILAILHGIWYAIAYGFDVLKQTVGGFFGQEQDEAPGLALR